MSQGISVKTRKRLWLRSGGRCAFNECDQELIEVIGAGSDTVLGIECHIVAQKDAPTRVARSESSLSSDERSKWRGLIDDRHGFANLVLMCANHSTIIDDPAGGYTVAQIVELKLHHETAEDARRAGSNEGGAAQLRYAEIVDEWETRVDLDNWLSWMSGVFGDGHPRMDIDDFERLQATLDWLFRCILPGVEADLELALDNFRCVAQDLCLVLKQYPHEHLARGGVVAPIRFYNDPAWRESVGDPMHLHAMYEWYVCLLEDLALELTRSSNLVCHAVRTFLDPKYRVQEGLVSIQSGPYGDLTFREHRPTYEAGHGWHPYGEVQSFLTDRSTRDEHRGQGLPPRGLRLPGDPYLPPA